MEQLIWTLTEWRGPLAWAILGVMSYISIRCLVAARGAEGAFRHRLVTCGAAIAMLLPAGIHPGLGILPPLTTLGVAFLASSSPGRSPGLRMALNGVGLGLVLVTAAMACSGYILSLGSGPSMWPNSSRHLSLALMKSQTSGFKRGDTVSFGVPGNEAAPDPETGWPTGRYHKRIIGLPGDRVETDDYTIRVNGNTIADCRPELAVETFKNSTWLCRGHLEGITYTMVWGDPEIWMNGRQQWEVEKDEVLVFGDNLPESADSRYRGPIRLRWLVGRFSSSW